MGDACDVQSANGKWETKWRVHSITPSVVIVVKSIGNSSQRALVNNLVRRPIVAVAEVPDRKVEHGRAFYDRGVVDEKKVRLCY